MVQGFAGDNVLLELVLQDGDTGKFPQVTIYNAAGASQGTFDLTHTALGLYQVEWTSSETEGHYSAIFITYNEIGHTTESNKHGRAAEHILLVVPGGVGGVK
jgi:hypothetical protein